MAERGWRRNRDATKGRGINLNQQPLGYEGSADRDHHQLTPTNPKEILDSTPPGSGLGAFGGGFRTVFGHRAQEQKRSRTIPSDVKKRPLRGGIENGLCELIEKQVYLSTLIDTYKLVGI